MKASKLPSMNELIVLGRRIGTYSDWNQLDGFGIMFYDFIPVSEFNGSLLEHSSISIQFDIGKIEAYDDEEDNIIYSMDLIQAVKDCPLYEEKE